MAKKLSPEEAAVMIIRRRLQQVEKAREASRQAGEEKKKPGENKARQSKDSKAGR